MVLTLLLQPLLPVIRQLPRQRWLLLHQLFKRHRCLLRKLRQQQPLPDMPGSKLRYQRREGTEPLRQ